MMDAPEEIASSPGAAACWEMAHRALRWARHYARVLVEAPITRQVDGPRGWRSACRRPRGDTSARRSSWPKEGEGNSNHRKKPRQGSSDAGSVERPPTAENRGRADRWQDAGRAFRARQSGERRIGLSTHGEEGSSALALGVTRSGSVAATLGGVFTATMRSMPCDAPRCVRS